MQWLLVVLAAAACLLGNSCVAKQSDDSAPLIWNDADHGSSSPSPLKLDPILRRALLRALTQLELEAQKKATGVDPTENTPTPSDDGPLDEAQEANIKRDLEELLGNYENTFQPLEEPQPPVMLTESPDMIVLDEQNSQHADEVSVINYEVPSEKTTTPGDDLHETTSFVDKPQESAIFFQDQQPGPEQKKPETQAPPEIDIQSNFIPSSTQLTDVVKTGITAKRGSEQDSNPLATSSTDKKAVVKSNDLAADRDSTKLDLEDHDVSIFQAPLVAAFTLQQDEKGNPRSVVPLLRRPQSNLVTQQQQRLQQQTTQLLHQQQHFQQQPLHLAEQQQQQQHFQPQSLQLRDQHQRFQPQPQQLTNQEQRFQPQPQQLTNQEQRFQQQPPQLTREQELERKTRLLQQQLLQLQQQQQLQQQYQFQQQQQQLFKQQQLLEQEQLRQRQQQLFQEEQQRLRFQQQSFVPLEQPPASQRQRSQRQETGTGIVDFQQSVGFQFRQQPNNLFQQQFAQSTFPQSSNPASDFVFNNLNSFKQPVQSPTLNSQLQNLLYQSGVAGDLQSNGASPQEDLNIVSKILSLNHEGRGNRAGRDTLEAPSRFIAPPLP